MIAPLRFDGAECQALDQLFLAEPAEDHDRPYGGGGDGGQAAEEQALGRAIALDELGERGCVRRGQAHRPVGCVPAEDEAEQRSRDDAAPGERDQDLADLAPGRHAIHLARLDDFPGDFLEVGEEHPDDDRQIDQAQDQYEQEMGIVDAEEVLGQKRHRVEHRGGGKHLGRQHPHQHVPGVP